MPSFDVVCEANMVEIRNALEERGGRRVLRLVQGRLHEGLGGGRLAGQDRALLQVQLGSRPVGGRHGSNLTGFAVWKYPSMVDGPAAGPAVDIADLLVQAAAEDPGRLAIVESGGRRVTWGELDDEVGDEDTAARADLGDGRGEEARRVGEDAVGGEDRVGQERRHAVPGGLELVGRCLHRLSVGREWAILPMCWGDGSRSLEARPERNDHDDTDS